MPFNKLTGTYIERF